MGMPVFNEKAFAEWDKRLKSVEAERRRLMQEEGLDKVNADYRAHVTYPEQQ